MRRNRIAFGKSFPMSLLRAAPLADSNAIAVALCGDLDRAAAPPARLILGPQIENGSLAKVPARHCRSRQSRSRQVDGRRAGQARGPKLIVAARDRRRAGQTY